MATGGELTLTDTGLMEAATFNGTVGCHSQALLSGKTLRWPQERIKQRVDLGVRECTVRARPWRGQRKGHREVDMG